MVMWTVNKRHLVVPRIITRLDRLCVNSQLCKFRNDNSCRCGLLTSSSGSSTDAPYQRVQFNRETLQPYKCHAYVKFGETIHMDRFLDNAPSVARERSKAIHAELASCRERLRTLTQGKVGIPRARHPKRMLTGAPSSRHTPIHSSTLSTSCEIVLLRANSSSPRSTTRSSVSSRRSRVRWTRRSPSIVLA